MFGPKKLPPLGSFREDVTRGFPPARMAKHRLETGDWRAARETLLGLTDPAARHLATGVVAEVAAKGPATWLEEWTTQYAHEGLTWLIRGSVSFHAAARARGSAKAVDTSDNQWREMLELNDIAQEQLNRAISLDPNDPVPWFHLLWIAMTVSEPNEAKQGLYAEGVKRGSFYDFERARLLSLAKKWGGSHEAMLQFARTHPKFSPMLVAEAHYERALYAIHWDHTIQRASEYFAQPAVKSEIAAVAAKVGDVPGPNEASVANLMSYVTFMTDDVKTARVWFERAKGIRTHPWEEKLHTIVIRKVNELLS